MLVFFPPAVLGLGWHKQGSAIAKVPVCKEIGGMGHLRKLTSCLGCFVQAVLIQLSEGHPPSSLTPRASVLPHLPQHKPPLPLHSQPSSRRTPSFRLGPFHSQPFPPLQQPQELSAAFTSTSPPGRRSSQQPWDGSGGKRTSSTKYQRKQRAKYALPCRDYFYL